MMRVSILVALLCLVAPGPSPGAWGPACAPAVAGPRYAPMFAPAGPVPAFAPVPLWQPGPGGVCSARCSCGCNEGRPCDCNGPAAAPPAKAEAELPTGVDGSKLGGEKRITLGGPGGPVRISEDEAERILTGQFKDDSGKKSLTLIGGTDIDRKGLRSTLEGLDWLRERVHYQDYPSGDEMVKKHDCDGLTLYLQERPSGKKLLHVKRISAGSTSGIIDRIKQSLGLGSPAPPPPAPPLIGPDGTPLPPAPPQEGYSTYAVGGTGILGMLLLAGLQWGWGQLRQRQGQQPAVPAAPQVPALPSAPPVGPLLQPAPPLQPAAPDLASLLEQAALQLLQQRLAGLPIGPRLQGVLALLQHAVSPAPAPVEQPKP